MSGKLHHSCSPATLIVAALLATGARAADVGAQGAPASATTLADIVVTAEKRSERLEEVPIRALALTGDSLARARVLSVQDLAIAVPSLNTNQAIGYAEYYLRGVGQDQLVAWAQPGVPVYIDGVAQQILSTPVGQFLGVDRIEVLYGPQGTLYGRNAVGGAINVVTLSPKQEPDAALTATYGSYEREAVSGYVSGGVTSSLALGLYASETYGDTYFHFFSPVTNQPTKDKSADVRLKAVWTPTSTTRVTATAEYQYTSNVDVAVLRQAQANATGFVVGHAPVQIQPYVIQANSPAVQNVQRYVGELQAEQDFPWATLVSITGYQRAGIYQTNDSDATSAFLAAGGTINPDISDFSEELRLQSRDGSKIQWVGGLFYDQDHEGMDPLPKRTPALIINLYVPIHFETKAVFAQTTIPLIYGFKVTLGARYNEDTSKRLPGDTFTASQATGAVISNVPTGGALAKWDSFTPKVTLEYQAGPLLAYFTYAKGFKAGQYNPSLATNLTPAAPEKLTDFEGGAKVDLFDRRLRIDGSVFHYDYTDLQVTQLINTSVGLVPFTDNAARAEIYGGDITVAALLARGLTVSDGLSYTHGVYTSYPDAQAQVPAAVGNKSIQVDATGNFIQRTPKWTNSLTVSYERTLFNAGSAFGNLTWAYNSGFPWDASGLYSQKAYNVLNASVGYNFPGRHFSVSLWVTNLTNELYENYEVPNSLGTYAVDAPPRMYGVTLSYKLR